MYNIYDEINNKNKSKTSLNSSDNTEKEDKKNQVDEKSPKIGDIRISFTQNPVCIVTVLAKQKGDSLVPYKIKDLEIFEAGLNIKSVDNFFNLKKANNNMNKLFYLIFISIGVFILTNISENKKNNYKGCFLSLAISFVLVTGIAGFIWFQYYPSYAIRSLGLTIIGILFTVIILAFSYFKNSNLNKNINNNKKLQQ